MALNTNFNAKNGISVGIPSVPVIDNVGNATFKSISATSNISVSGTSFLSGGVGIGTRTPNEKLTVVGGISSTSVIYASGGNSNIWNQTYSAYQATSGNFAVKNADNNFTAPQTISGAISSNSNIYGANIYSNNVKVATENFSIAMAIALG